MKYEIESKFDIEINLRFYYEFILPFILQSLFKNAKNHLKAINYEKKSWRK